MPNSTWNQRGKHSPFPKCDLGLQFFKFRWKRFPLRVIWSLHFHLLTQANFFIYTLQIATVHVFLYFFFGIETFLLLTCILVIFYWKNCFTRHKLLVENSVDVGTSLHGKPPLTSQLLSFCFSQNVAPSAGCVLARRLYLFLTARTFTFTLLRTNPAGQSRSSACHLAHVTYFRQSFGYSKFPVMLLQSGSWGGSVVVGVVDFGVVVGVVTMVVPREVSWTSGSADTGGGAVKGRKIACLLIV